VVAAVVLAEQDKMRLLPAPEVMAAPERRQAFPAAALLMQAAVAVAVTVVLHQQVEARLPLAAAEMVVAFRVQMVLLQLPIQAVVAEPVVITHRLLAMAQQAAPA
jgi:hypothetical protein